MKWNYSHEDFFFSTIHAVACRFYFREKLFFDKSLSRLVGEMLCRTYIGCVHNLIVNRFRNVAKFSIWFAISSSNYFMLLFFYFHFTIGRAAIVRLMQFVTEFYWKFTLTISN